MNTQQQVIETLLQEGLIPLDDVPKILGRSSSGGCFDRRTIWRWVRKGVLNPSGDRVRLDATKVGHKWMTSEGAVERFLARRSQLPVDPPESWRPRKTNTHTTDVLRRFGLHDDEGGQS